MDEWEASGGSPHMPASPASSSSSSTPTVFDIDLGAFELVSGGIRADTLLRAQEDPVIYHKDLPVHSVHHDTVHTEAAIENLMNAPQSMLAASVPPTMVADNYCFVVDGDRVRMGDIMSDEQWWRHTSRPTKYFYSEDLRRFYRVNVLAAKGRILSARLASTMPTMGAGAVFCTSESVDGGGGGVRGTSALTSPRQSTSAAVGGGRASAVVLGEPPRKRSNERRMSLFRSLSTARDSIVAALLPPGSGTLLERPSLLASSLSGSQPRSSLSLGPSAPWPPGGPPGSSAGVSPIPPSQLPAGAGAPMTMQRGEALDLTHVYRVVRFYSFWKTCTSFHRIVTMIDRVQSVAPQEAPAVEWSSGTSAPDSATTSASTVATATSATPTAACPIGGAPFQRRLFVQYLWRNAKAADKARVQREFDPRQQRLLRCVTLENSGGRGSGGSVTGSEQGTPRLRRGGVRNIAAASGRWRTLRQQSTFSSEHSESESPHGRIRRWPGQR